MSDLLLPAVQKGSVATVDTDPYYNLVSLHLKGDVNTGRNYNAFSDASSNNFRLTNNGDVRGSSFSPYGTSWSNYFSGVSGFLSYSTITLGASFTIEFFVYFPTTPSANAVIISNIGAGGTNWVGVSNTAISLSYSAGTRTFAFTPAGGTWYYVQLINSASLLTCYVNGTQVGTAQTGPSSFTLDRVGGYTNVGFTGYLSSVRVNSTALAVSALPTSPLTEVANTVLLTCQSNRLLDNRASPLTLTKGGSLSVSSFSPFLETDTTTGSAYHDSSGDSLTIANNAAFNLTGDFSIEAWMFPMTTAVTVGIATKYVGGSLSSSEWYFVIDGASSRIAIALDNNSGEDYFTSATNSIIYNAWNHCVVTRVGNAVRLFVNGVLQGYNTTSRVLNSTSTAVTMGGNNNYQSDLRIVKGGIPSAYSTAATTVGTVVFTPPTSPLSASASLTGGSVSLLTLQERGAYNTIGFQDESEYQHVITRPSGANVAQGTFSPFSPNGWSVYWATGGIINYDTTTVGTDFNPGSSNFTMEMWLIPLSTAATLVNWGHNDGSAAAGIQLGLSGNSLSFTVNASDGAHPGNTSVSISYTNWTHIALVRNGVALTLYVNGVPSATSSIGASATVNTGSWYEIGQLRFGVSPTFKGYLSNFRMNFNAVYTVDFSNALPTGPLTSSASTRLLILQSNQPTKDASSYNKSPYQYSNGWQLMPISPFKPVAYDPAVHGGSGYFDGTTDFLDLPINNAFAIGTGDFTFDCWVYPLASNSGLFTMTASGVNDLVISNNWNPSTGSTTSVTASVTLGSTNITGPANAVIQNTWNHIAVVRRSGSVRVYVNGAGGTQTANTTSVSGSYAPRIGALYTHSASATPACYVSSMRLVKGVAVYDPSQSTITVPSGPLPLINNTSLLLNFTNGGVIDSTGKNVIETVGNAGVVTTTIKKYGSGSMYFDGTGDYLAGPSNNALSFGTDAFTIEGWVYALSTPADAGFFTNGGAATGSLGFYFLTGYLRFDIYNGSGFAAGTLLPLNQWVHVACVRSGNTVTLYQNGVNVGSATVTNSNTSSLCYVGTKGWDLTKVFNGYIDDLRITKGYARYVTGTGDNANKMVFNGTNTLALPTKAFPDRGQLGTTASAAPPSVDYLVVGGGGGGGGRYCGGGGGAGGFLTATGFSVSAGTNYPLTVGAGGPGGAANNKGSNGFDSIFSNITATGGGGGGSSLDAGPIVAAGNGGSGGGGSWRSVSQVGAGGTGISGQGYAGQTGLSNGTIGGGGGGAGEAGGTDANGYGGDGLPSSITGVETYYAGGGGGGNQGTTTPYQRPGGDGGGGAGAIDAIGGAPSTIQATPGTPNTGGGGGAGCWNNTASGAAGGSGVVILAYPTSYKPLTASLGLTYTIDTVTRPGYRVYKFVAGSGTISW